MTQPNKETTLSDLCNLLPGCQPDMIAETLRQRYLNDRTYTSIHHSVLIAINPLKSDHVHHTSATYCAEYKDFGSARANQWREPHLFQLVNHAYFHMRRTSINQSILFSGESASGKSEQLRQSLDHLSRLSSHNKKGQRLAQQLQDVQIILGCFGNAKTATHDHASRFAQYVEVHFTERGRMTGARSLCYGLEKRRVTRTVSGERNFHVFYSMLAAAASGDDTLGLRSADATAYRYLAHNHSLSQTKSSLDDGQQFSELRRALQAMGINRALMVQIFHVLAAILHLGNLVFVQDASNVQDAAMVKNMDELTASADLLGVDAKALLNALTYKSKLIKRDITTLFLDPEHASRQRDDLCEALYALLFAWIGEQINIKLAGKSEGIPPHSVLGLVDLPGFVSQKSHSTQVANQDSSFDQLLVGFMNESIHQFMLSTVFERDVHEYKEQGLPVATITHNLPTPIGCLDQLVHPAKGLFGCMDAQVDRLGARSTDGALIDQWANVNRRSTTANGAPMVTLQKSDTGGRQFMLQHYWGSTVYDPRGWLDRNEDYLCNDFVALFRGNAYSASTTNGLVGHMFGETLLGEDVTTRNRVLSPQQAIQPLRRPTMAPPAEKLSVTGVPSLSEQLAGSFQTLTTALAGTIPWFVLCMRPNDLSLPASCDAKKLAAQVANFQLPSLIQRLDISYNTIFSMSEFFERYAVSLPLTLGQPVNNTLPHKERCRWIAQCLGWDDHFVGIGNDKIYLSNTAFRILEDDLRSLEKSESKKTKLTPSNLPPGRHKGFDTFSYQDDQMSSAMSEDDDMEDAPSHAYSSDVVLNHGQGLDGKGFRYDGSEKTTGDDVVDDTMNQPMSSARRRWLFLVWLLTWWVPSPFLSRCGGMQRKDIRMAWREKVALCILIFLLAGLMVGFIIFFGPLVCPHQDVYSLSELQSRSTKKDAFVAIRGEVFDLTKFAPHHWAPEVIPESVVFDYAGKDATNLFPVQVSALCDGATAAPDSRVADEVVLDFQINLTDKNAAYHDFRYFTNDYRPDWYYEQMVYLRKNYRMGFMGYEPSDILRQATNMVNVGGILTHRQWAILNGDVYDLTYYLMGGRAPRAPTNAPPPPAGQGVDLNFMDNSIVELFRQLAGTDISKHFEALPLESAVRHKQMVCLRNLFFVGKVDSRRSPQCLFSEYFLLIITGNTGFLCAVVLFKFLAALQLGSRREPEDYDKFIVCQVPCYTESEESLRKTIDSIAVLRYDDKRKLMFIVCDGMIVGSGNDRPTPRIVLDILGVDANVDPEPLSFLSLGEGAKQHNMGKIYSGLYECSGHVVPYVVVVKVGGPGERQKPGNRGKRDSQMVLMRFLNKVHFGSAMTPMELEIYHQIQNVIGVSPSFYEFVLMIDADTEVLPDSLNRMVSCFVHDAKIVGLCGETRLENEKDSWVTMIQVYEYYISHFLSKAFESLFGSVTCLPGCFCMYRLRSPGTKNHPLLIANQVIQDYAENRVNTLHKKNLLHLGEDRYLTTLILKHFPNYKTKFTADAACMTNAPDRWSILLSQRRRWINSTIHNLGELAFLPQLCGFCCFSMRFVVILDLLSTLAMPAVVCYLGYLIYRIVTDASQVPMISILTLAGVYGLQAVIFILRRKWEHIGWMIVYILAIPLFSFFIPIYSFWHFDDFSWGNTRVVLGEGGQKRKLQAEEGTFDPAQIPLKTWQDHEEELWEAGSVETKGTSLTAHSRRTATQYPPMSVAPSTRLGPTGLRSATPSILFSGTPSLMLPPPSLMVPPISAHHPASVYSEALPDAAMQGPHDEEIRHLVHMITANADLATVTKKQVREQLSLHYGIDMAYKKDFINYCIEEALQQQYAPPL